MGMVVQHNISAMNANEAMRKNVAGLKKQTEKLSTGYNINRAADNAAGLAISEKMRSQIRGLTQASSNANDAISLIQTAEGGLQETEDIMQRMRELAVQSANGTYTDEDREQIQYEVEALKAEVDRIAQSTEYNEMKLLDGSLSGVGASNTEYGAKYGVINDGITKDEQDAFIAKGGSTGTDTAVKGSIADGTGNTDKTMSKAIVTLSKDNTEDAAILKTLKDKYGIEQVYAEDGTVNKADTDAAVLEAVSKLSGDQFRELTSIKKADGSALFSEKVAYDPATGEKGDYEKIADMLDKMGNASAGFGGSVVTSNVQGASINVTTGATKGGEGAAWDEAGKTLTLNLVEGKTYTQDEIDKLIAGADTKKADGVVAEISLKLKDGVYSANNGDYTAKTSAGERAESKTISLLANTSPNFNKAYELASKVGNVLTNISSSKLKGATTTDTDKIKQIASETAELLGYNSWDEMQKADGKNIGDAIMNLSDEDLKTLNTNLTKLGTGGTSAVSDAETAAALKWAGAVVGDGTASTWTANTGYATQTSNKDTYYNNKTDKQDPASTITGIFKEAKTWAVDGALTNKPTDAELNSTSTDATARDKVLHWNEANAIVNSRGKVNAGVLTAPTTGYGDQIQFTSNSYGVDDRTFEIATDVKAGQESVEASIDDTPGNKDGKYTIHLATGVEYSNEDIEKIMKKAGLDYSVNISDSNKPDGDVKMKLDIAVSEANATATRMAKGFGVGKEETATGGEGLTFQIGANGVEDQRLTVNVDDMSSSALGIKDISVAKQDDANDAINKIDDAIKAVSTQRAKLGAVQNRLEHTVNSLNTANENMTASESQIRDTDMAAEMIKYTKSNILQQASQSMLAQANQQPQGVLQLLG